MSANSRAETKLSRHLDGGIAGRDSIGVSGHGVVEYGLG